MGCYSSTPTPAKLIEGNTKDPVAFMRIQYCGGWGYLKYAKDLIKEVESNVANKY